MFYLQYRITPELKLAVTEHGWDTVSNLVYVDQPINTGFSYSDDPSDAVHDEAKVADDMIQFLAEFVQAHPELEGNDFYITGESYAGHYVPAVAYKVFRASQSGEFTGLKLKGLAVGNGLTKPEIQYGAYADYALGQDMVGPMAASAARTVYPACKAAIKRCGGGVDPDGPSPEPDAKKAACMTAVAICQTIPSGLMAVAGAFISTLTSRKGDEHLTLRLTAPPLFISYYRELEHLRRSQEVRRVAVLRLFARSEVSQRPGRSFLPRRRRPQVGDVQR